MTESNEQEPTPLIAVDESPEAEWRDPFVEAYKKDVDRTLLRENLKLTVEERIRKAQSFHVSIEAWREAGRRKRSDS